MKFYITAVIMAVLFLTSALLILNCKPTEADPTDIEFNLCWTAPDPNDGDIPDATCASYDLRYSDVPLSDANWNAATQVPNLPNPAVPGTPENTRFTILWESSRTIYFAIKSYDNAGNVSPISNVYQTLSPDIVGPEPITDLGG